MLTPGLTLQDLRYSPASFFCYWSTGLNEREYPCNILQAQRFTSTRYKGPSLQLFFLNIPFSGATELHVSKGNVLICFNLVAIEKSEKTKEFEIKLHISKVRFLHCLVAVPI